MTKLKIIYKPIADLIPYARNSRTHSDAQVAQIAASIREFGWTNPVLLDGKNGIIAGHGRVMAAQKLGETEVPTIELSHMDDNQKRAYIIADNKLALNAGWDEQMLALEIGDLKDAGYDLNLTGFDLNELQSMDEHDDVENDDINSPIDENRNLLMIECQGERELETLFEEMQQRGYECKILS
jgi:ParB-like chromosome segregation protein Spo0J